MENEFFIYTKDEWDLSLLYCAELFSTIPSIVSNIRKRCKTDQIRYYEAAQKSPYFNHRNVRSYDPERAQIVTECLGILYAAEDDKDDRRLALKQIETTWPKEYACFKKINNETLKYIEDDINLGVADSVTPFLVRYLLPSASGDANRIIPLIKSEKEILNENLRNINAINRCAENYREAPELTEQDKLLVEMAESPDLLWDYQGAFSHPKTHSPMDAQYESAFVQNSTLRKKFYADYKSNYNYLRRCVGWQTFGQINEAFASRGLDLHRFFENNIFSKDLADQAVCFANVLSDRATRMWENDATHYRTSPEILNEMVFSPRQFVMFYYMLALLDEYADLRKKYEALAPESIALADSLKQSQVDHLRDEIEKLTCQLENAQAKNETLKAKIAAYQKGDLSSVKKVEARFEEQIGILESQLAAYEKTKPELEQLRDLFFRQNAEDTLTEFDEGEKDYKTELSKYKILIVGGHEQLRKNIKNAYPSVVILDGTLKSQDFHLVEGFDHVFILTQHMSHAVYYNLMKQLERFKVSFSYLSKTNVSLLADEMLKLI